MKKLLIFSYFFPPFNNAASRRWSEMIPELSKEYDIYVIANSSDGDLLVPISEEKIFRLGYLSNLNFSQIELKRGIIHKFISFFTEHLRTVDTTLISWYYKNRGKVKAIIQDVSPDIVITSVGPFSTSLFGFLARKNSKSIKWVVDIRDSMALFNPEEKNMIQHYIDKKFDKTVIAKADYIITVSNSLALTLGRFYRKEVSVIYNGFRESDYLPVKNESRKSIEMYYAGRIYTHRLKAFYCLIDFCKDTDFTLKIRLLGSVEQKHELESYSKSKGFSNLTILPPTSGEVIIEEEQKADVLIILEEMNKNNDISRGTLTGKLFEYLQNYSPIMAICRDDSEIGEILDKSNRGRIVTTKVEFDTFIKVRNNYLLKDLDIIDQYSRKNQAIKLKLILDKL